MRVQLVRNSTVLDSKPLEWASPTKDLQEESVGAGWGVGDLLGPPPGMRAWVAEIEDTGYATVARPVKLAGDQVGLLVTQRMGVEPVKRRHELLMIKADRLVVAWSRTEGTGPTRSATHVLPMREGREQVLYADGYEAGSSGGAEQPDRLELTSLWWDAERGKLAESPAAETVPLEITSFGTYPTVAQAYDAKGSCLFRYWILEAASFDGLPQKGYFIGAITSDSKLAREALAEADQCSTPSRGTIVPYKQRR